MKLQTAKGVRDLKPEEKILKQEILGSIRSIFELYGFLPIETPVLERFETLSAKYAGGAEILKETFKLKDQGGRKLGLRYDLTVPLARFIGMNPNIKLPFKRYQIGRSFRDGPVSSDRLREFWQCDIDTVGCAYMTADAEILAVVRDVFKKLGFDVIIKLNNRKILEGLLDAVGVEENKREDVILTIDKLEKISLAEMRKELKNYGLKDEAIDKLLKAIRIEGSDMEILSELSKLIKSKRGIDGLAETEELLSYLKMLGVEVMLVPSLARGLSYYTSTVFEVFLKKSRIKSAIAAGGRYDKMISQFLEAKKEYPAVGIAFGLDRLYEAVALTKKVAKKTITKAYVIPIKTLEESLKITKKLRQAGINTDIDLMDRSISKNLDYANSFGIPYVIFIGEKELKQGKVKLRDMASGKEEMLKVEDVVKRLRK